MTIQPDVEISVVVINWNGGKILQRCLLALQAQTYRNFEIIVVDNGSQDGSSEGLEEQYANLQVIRLGKNFGFAYANNQGAIQARGRWIAFLNNDAFPTPSWLSSLLSAAYQNPEFSSFASKIVQDSRPEIIDSCGIVFHTSGLSWNRGHNQPNSDEFEQPEEVFGACAAASMVGSSDFQQLGGFDEDYFIYHEDTDLALRLQLVGKRCLYVPDAMVFHLGSKTTGEESDFSVYHQQRNWLWTCWKDMPTVLFWRFLFPTLVANWFFFFFYLFRKQGGVFIKAKIHALIGLPRNLKKRQSIQASFNLSYPQMDCDITGSTQTPIDHRAKRQISVKRISTLMDHGWLSPYQLGKKYSQFLELKKKIL